MVPTLFTSRSRTKLAYRTQIQETASRKDPQLPSWFQVLGPRLIRSNSNQHHRNLVPQLRLLTELTPRTTVAQLLPRVICRVISAARNQKLDLVKMLPETALDKTAPKDWVKQLIPILFRNKIRTSLSRISHKPYNGTDEISKMNKQLRIL